MTSMRGTILHDAMIIIETERGTVTMKTGWSLQVNVINLTICFASDTVTTDTERGIATMKTGQYCQVKLLSNLTIL